MTDACPRGRFVWYELATSDPVAAQRFYTQLIGWTTKEGTAGDQPYTERVNGETHIGGVMQLADEAKKAGAPPHWLAYVAVPSVDETLRQAEGLGAKKRVGPMDIPTVGRFAVIQDPQGAAFALHSKKPSA